MLSHNFELMNQSQTRPDPIVLRRFRNLAAFLEKHSDEITTAGFQDLDPHNSDSQPAPPRVTLLIHYLTPSTGSNRPSPNRNRPGSGYAFRPSRYNA